ncbi:MAG: DUF4926 domain-containing protein [Gemmataceae bacterium]|nr:DUF4926 domain-containing protein [Gemmataceae bacterium]
MTYSVVRTESQSSAHYSGHTMLTTLASSESKSASHQGAPGNSFSDASTHNYTQQDTVTSTTAFTHASTSNYALYQGGVYSSESWNLSSYNLLNESASVSTYSHADVAASSKSGDFSARYSAAGILYYDLVGTFVETSGRSTVEQTVNSSSHSLSQQGTFAGGSFSLSSFAFAVAVASEYSSLATGTSLQTFAGANDIGQGAGNPTFTGNETGSLSRERSEAKSSSLSQQATFAGGSFNLTTVTYTASGSTDLTSSEGRDAAWSGGFSGNETYASDASGSDQYSVSATGSFAAGSFSLSSYVLSGSADVDGSTSNSRTQSLGTVTKSFARSQSLTASDSLYQAGTLNGGVYANTSYSYQDSSANTLTIDAQAQGLLIDETWTQARSTNVVLGGAQTNTAAATYSYLDGASPVTVQNAGSGSAPGPETSAVVMFAAPDARLVPLAGAGQHIAIDGGSADDATLAAAGKGAPVPVQIKTQAVADARAWLGGTQASSHQKITRITGSSSQTIRIVGGLAQTNAEWMLRVKQEVAPRLRERERDTNAGVVGMVVHIHRNAAAYQVEFMTLTGQTLAVATVLSGHCCRSVRATTATFASWLRLRRKRRNQHFSLSGLCTNLKSEGSFVAASLICPSSCGFPTHISLFRKLKKRPALRRGKDLYDSVVSTR